MLKLRIKIWSQTARLQEASTPRLAIPPCESARIIESASTLVFCKADFHMQGLGITTSPQCRFSNLQTDRIIRAHTEKQCCYKIMVNLSYFLKPCSLEGWPEECIYKLLQLQYDADAEEFNERFSSQSGVNTTIPNFGVDPLCPYSL